MENIKTVLTLLMEGVIIDSMVTGQEDPLQIYPKAA